MNRAACAILLQGTQNGPVGCGGNETRKKIGKCCSIIESNNYRCQIGPHAVTHESSELTPSAGRSFPAAQANAAACICTLAGDVTFTFACHSSASESDDQTHTCKLFCPGINNTATPEFNESRATN